MTQNPTWKRGVGGGEKLKEGKATCIPKGEGSKE